MRTATIDGHEIRTTARLHAQLAGQLAFPDYYGANFDALYDVLTTIAEPVVIELSHISGLKKYLGEDFERFLRVVEDAESDNDNVQLVWIGGPSYSHTYQHFFRKRG